MLNFVSKRIGRRIAATVGLAMALFGIGGLLLVLEETSRAREETSRRLLSTLARTITTSFHNFDPRQGQHPIDDIVADLGTHAEIEHLDVFDDRGRIRWAVDARRRGTIVDRESLSLVLSSTRARGAQGDARKFSGRLRAVVPLRRTSSCLPCHDKSSDPIGGVRIAASSRELLRGSVIFSRQVAAVAVFFVVLLTALLLFLIHRVVVLRLKKLLEVMTKAEEGDFLVRAEITSSDEIGLLATTFNKMLAKITDLRVERIDKDREMHQVLDELNLKEQLSRKSGELAETNTRLQEKLVQLSFLYDLGRDLASELDLEALLDRFTALVIESLGVPKFAVLLFDKDRAELTIVAAKGFGETSDLLGKKFMLGEHVLGHAMKRREAIYVPDLESDPRGAPHIVGSPTGTLLCVPVIYQDTVIGLLLFESQSKHAFREENRELFAAVGNHAALALANAQLFQQTLDLSNTDGLTGILNRRAMEARLELEWSRSLRDQSSLSLVMIDIDHFKIYNDQHGHQLGDETLRRVARILERNIRKVDALARYGGEEFVVILPRAKKFEALDVANKLHRSVEQSDFVQGYMQPLGRITISCGVATAPDDAQSIPEFIRVADEAMFLAKKTGRNQVVLASPPTRAQDLPTTPTSATPNPAPK